MNKILIFLTCFGLVGSTIMAEHLRICFAEGEGATVFANSNEISSKADSGKSITAIPDVCQSPSSPPAGPVPVPYPNIAASSDTEKGGKKVKVDGKEAMIKGDTLLPSESDEEGTSSEAEVALPQPEKKPYTIKGYEVYPKQQAY